MSSNSGKRKLIRIHYKTLDTALLRPLPADLAPWICCYFPAETVFPILLLDTVGICSIDFDIQLQKSWFMRSTGKLATAYLCIKSLKKIDIANCNDACPWLAYVTPSFFRAWGSQTQNVHHFHPKFSSILPVRLKSTCSQATRMEQLCTTEPAKRSLKKPGISKGNLSDQRIQEWTNINIKQWNNVKSSYLSTSE